MVDTTGRITMDVTEENIEVENLLSAASFLLFLFCAATKVMVKRNRRERMFISM